MLEHETLLEETQHRISNVGGWVEGGGGGGNTNHYSSSYMLECAYALLRNDRGNSVVLFCCIFFLTRECT